MDQAQAHAGGWTRVSFFISRMWGATFSPRTANLPRVASDLDTIRANRGAVTVTWVGHATLLIQLDGVNILTDPHWSDRASPVSFAGPRRVSAPGMRFEDLPPIHLVVISHDHYDHLDVATVKRLAAEHRPRFLVPLGLKAWFADIGITEVEELDWWGRREERGLSFTCVPAQHFSGRTLWDRNRRLWSGWVIAGQTKRLYFAGDTAYFGEVERAPVDGDEALTTRVGEASERLLRRRVARLHDDRRHVGADRHRRQIERAQALADLLEPAEVCGVPGEVEPLGLSGDDPAAPEAAVAVP